MFRESLDAALTARGAYAGGGGRPRLALEERDLLVGGARVALTESEAALVACFLDAGRRVVSRAELTRALWGASMDDSGRAVDTHIHRLRKKLGPLPSVEIATIRSRGFRFDYCDESAGRRD